MIFLLTGTHEQQFDRVVRAVDELETGEEKVIQYGYSTYRPVSSKSRDFMSFDEVKNHMKQASVVVTHAGTGSVMLALSLGIRPIVAPRYKIHGEHVDDHQLQLVDTLVKDGLVVPFYDGDSLEARIHEARVAMENPRKIEPDARLVSDIRKIIETSQSD